MNHRYCPRCGEQTYESLATHSHCFSCNYSPDLETAEEPAIPQWALDQMKEETPEIDNEPDAVA